MLERTGAGLAVVGLGARTPVGMTLPASAAAVRCGITGFTEHPFMVDSAGKKMIVARAPYLGDETGPDRLVTLGAHAALEALAPVARIRDRAKEIAVTLCLPGTRPGQPTMSKAIASRFAAALRDSGLVARVQTIDLGHAGGVLAIQAAQRDLAAGTQEFHLVGGVDSYMEPETLEWLEKCEQLHSAGPANNAWGFIPGEAAGFCLLASEKARLHYQLSASCRVLAAGVARESSLIKTDTVCIGLGLTAAVREALTALPDGIKVDRIICDQNGEAYRADEFGFMLVRLSERFNGGSDFLAPADCWGDVGAASIPLSIALAAAAAERGYARGPYYLVWASSEGGERGAALLQLNLEPTEGA